MPVLAEVFAALAGVIHVAIFAMESLLFADRRVSAQFRVDRASVAAVRPWAFNQGFYNLFLALGCLGGIIVSHVDNGAVVGRTLTYFTCGCMLAAALVLIATDRRMLRGALVQGAAPALALLFAAVL